MKYLLTLTELLTNRTNGWGCGDCGRVWVDISRGMSGPYEPSGDPDCPHRQLMRARIAR